MNWFEKIFKIGRRVATTPGALEQYSEYLDIKKNGLHLQEDELVAYAEQVVWRMERCEPCVKKGYCPHCSCTMPGGMITPSFECSAGRFHAMLPPNEWDKKKKDDNILKFG